MGDRGGEVHLQEEMQRAWVEFAWREGGEGG